MRQQRQQIRGGAHGRLVPKSENERSLVYIPPDPDPGVSDAPGPEHLPARPERGQVIIGGTYSNRARGFAWATWQLSAVIALAVVALAWAFGWVPLVSVPALALLVGGFACVWLVAFALYTFVSVEGAEFLEVVLFWRYVRREQGERWRRYWGDPSMDRDRPTWAEIIGGAFRDVLISAFVLVVIVLIVAMLLEAGVFA